jgi:glycosyltransferase involved in cell wall biosynthesis
MISDGWGGAENVVFHLAKYIENLGHQVFIILNDETFTYFEELKNVKLCNIGSLFKVNQFLVENFHLSLPKSFYKNKKSLMIFKKLVYPLLRKLNYLKIRKKILQVINNIKPDIIHFHNPNTLQISSYLLPNIRYPTLYTSHGLDLEGDIKQISKLTIRKNIRLLKHFDKITAVSTFEKNYLISKGVTQNIEVIYNGIDFENIKNILNSDIEDKHDKKFTLIFPGGQKKNKGGKILLKALNIVKKVNTNIKLYYCGFVNTDFKKKYQDKNVIFTGLLPYNEYLKLLSKSDCLILLSKTEAFPIAILEAMSLGKTIITTPVGGIPEFFNSGINGFFVEQEPQKVSEKIIFLINNQNIRINISENNIKHAKKFQWNSITNQYTKSYKKIITKSKKNN